MFLIQVLVLICDENIVNVLLNVQYCIDDLQQYLFGIVDVDQVLEQLVQSVVCEEVGCVDFNVVLNNCGLLVVVVEECLQVLLKVFKIGLIVIGLILQDVCLLEEVKLVFDEVNGVQQVKECLINEVQVYVVKVVLEV